MIKKAQITVLVMGQGAVCMRVLYIFLLGLKRGNNAKIEGLFGILEEVRDVRKAGKNRDTVVTTKSGHSRLRPNHLVDTIRMGYNVITSRAERSFYSRN